MCLPMICKESSGKGPDESILMVKECIVQCDMNSSRSYRCTEMFYQSFFGIPSFLLAHIKKQYKGGRVEKTNKMLDFGVTKQKCVLYV